MIALRYPDLFGIAVFEIFVRSCHADHLIYAERDHLEETH